MMKLQILGKILKYSSTKEYDVYCIVGFVYKV